jgi:hypothetical protein
MSTQTKYTSIDRIISKYIRDFDNDLTEVDAIEWIGEALELIGAVKQYEEALSFIEVKNGQCLLPNGFHAIIQIAKNYCHDSKKCPSDIIDVNSSPEWKFQDGSNVNSNIELNKDKPVIIDENGNPISDYEVAYYRPFFDLKFEYDLWRGKNIYTNCFSPVRLATHSFFNSIVCSSKADKNRDVFWGEDTSMLYHREIMDEYTIVNGEILRFSFRDGQIALSYLRQVLDTDTGYPLVPDHIYYTEALSEYINYKMQKRLFYKKREGSQALLLKSELDWNHKCKQAANYTMMLKGVDEYQNFLEQRNYLIPRSNDYYSFFGRLGRPETKRFNNPDMRNKYTYGYGYSLFRGGQFYTL